MIKAYTHSTHRWSGWPGAYCMHCDIEDPIEQCLADHNAPDVWNCPDHKVSVCAKYIEGTDPYTY